MYAICFIVSVIRIVTFSVEENKCLGMKWFSYLFMFTDFYFVATCVVGRVPTFLHRGNTIPNMFEYFCVVLVPNNYDGIIVFRTLSPVWT